jgi:hypothetical protein
MMGHGKEMAVSTKIINLKCPAAVLKIKDRIIYWANFKAAGALVALLPAAAVCCFAEANLPYVPYSL